MKQKRELINLDIKKIKEKGKWEERIIHQWSKLAIIIGVTLVCLASIVVRLGR